MISLTSTSALGGQNAEWIVEDFEEDNSLVAFADFGNVTFVNCEASTAKSSAGVDSATMMDIQNSEGIVMTSVDVMSGSQFKVSYVSSTSTSAGSGSGHGGNNGNGKGNFGSEFKSWAVTAWDIWAKASSSGSL
jgi:hypothetical protein